MKQFFKDHSYDMVKLMLNQIAIAIFGFSLTLVAGNMENETLRTVAAICSILFYLFLTYVTAWGIGYRDHTSVSLGKKKLQRGKGFLVALCANALNLLLAVFIAVGYIPGVPELLLNVSYVSQFFATLLQGMFSGLMPLQIAGVALKDLWFVFFLLPLPAILVCGVSYLFGVKDVKYTSVFNQNKKSDKKQTVAPKLKKDD